MNKTEVETKNIKWLLFRFWLLASGFGLVIYSVWDANHNYVETCCTQDLSIGHMDIAVFLGVACLVGFVVSLVFKD